MMLVLESKKYNPAKTSEWTDQMGNKILEKLRDVSPYFKYVVSCVIVQKVGAGLHYESIAHWDSKTDGLLTTKFENDSLICITTIVAAAI